MRCACGVERDAGALDRALHAIFERGALDASVNVLDRQPRRGWSCRATQVSDSSIDESDHERARRDTLVQAAEGDRLFLHQNAGRVLRARLHARSHHLDDDGGDAVRRLTQGQEGLPHSTLANAPLQPVADARLKLRLDDLTAEGCGSGRAKVTIRHRLALARVTGEPLQAATLPWKSRMAAAPKAK